MQEYATEKLAGLKLCTPTIPEEEMVCLLIRHFPSQIQNLLKNLLPLTAEKLITQLGSYDATYQRIEKQSKPKTGTTVSSTIVETKQNYSKNQNQKNRNEEENKKEIHRSRSRDKKNPSDGRACGEWKPTPSTSKGTNF